MAKNIFLDPLNDRELMSSFGIQQENAPLTPEELAQMTTPVMEEAPIPTVTTPTTKPTVNNITSKQSTKAPIEDTQDALSPEPPAPEKPMSRSEALIAEYNKLLGKDQQSLEEARSRDRMLKVGGALGDALATYLNAQSQMNVKAPGVQVQQGAGLGKIADMFATAPEIASDVAARRQALMDQYKQLAIGESAAAKRELEKQRIQAMEEKNRLYGKQIEKMGAGREEAKQFREEAFDFRKKEAEYNKISRLQDSFNKDKQVVKAEERIAAASTMRDFLKDNNPIGAEAAKRFAARASGEVGTLTDQDVSVFGGSKAVTDRLEQAAKELATGTLTENNRKFMLQLADTFEKAGRRDLQDRLKIYSKQGTKRTNLSENEVEEIIRPDLVIQRQELQKEQPNTIMRKDPKSGRTVEYDAITKKPIRFVD